MMLIRALVMNQDEAFYAPERDAIRVMPHPARAENPCDAGGAQFFALELVFFSRGNRIR